MKKAIFGGLTALVLGAGCYQYGADARMIAEQRGIIDVEITSYDYDNNECASWLMQRPATAIFVTGTEIESRRLVEGVVCCAKDVCKPLYFNILPYYR